MKTKTKPAQDFAAQSASLREAVVTAQNMIANQIGNSWSRDASLSYELVAKNPEIKSATEGVFQACAALLQSLGEPDLRLLVDDAVEEAQIERGIVRGAAPLPPYLARVEDLGPFPDLPTTLEGDAGVDVRAVADALRAADDRNLRAIAGAVGAAVAAEPDHVLEEALRVTVAHHLPNPEFFFVDVPGRAELTGYYTRLQRDAQPTGLRGVGFRGGIASRPLQLVQVTTAEDHQATATPGYYSAPRPAQMYREIEA